MEEDKWPNDIPIWVDDVQKWMTGLTRRTTCDDVIYALLYSRDQLDTDSTEHYAVFERWRAVERPLQGRTKIVKVWTAWGAEQPNVQLIVRRLDDYFMPPGTGYSRTRRRHRHSKGQRVRHVTSCRCSSRSQCIRCGKLRALEHLVKHMVRQERRLQELQQRMEDTEREIAEHETRMHVRRVQQDGLDYVQDSYLHHDSQDSSSSSSEDPVDAVLLSVGEERLEEYLSLCDKLYDVTARLDRAQQMACNLAREIQAGSSVSGVSCHQEGSKSHSKTDSELETLQVQLTRAVAASVLQQQQELELARELAFWETQLTDRTNKLKQLGRQVKAAEESTSNPVCYRDLNSAQATFFCSDTTHSVSSGMQAVVETSERNDLNASHILVQDQSSSDVELRRSVLPGVLNVRSSSNSSLASKKELAADDQTVVPPRPHTRLVNGRKCSPTYAERLNLRTDHPAGKRSDDGQPWCLRDDSGLSQSASDSSTDGIFPGLEADDHSHPSDGRKAGHSAACESLPRYSKLYPTSDNPFSSSLQNVSVHYSHPVPPHMSGGIMHSPESKPCVREKVPQSTDQKPKLLHINSELTGRHLVANNCHISSSSVSSDDNMDVPLILHTLPVVHETRDLTRISHPDDGLYRPPAYSRPDQRFSGDTTVSSLKQVTPLRAKCVRFADELTCRWREDGDSNSDDTGLSSMHGDDTTPLETLV